MIPGDTIVAISSAVGPAARMIVRASGPEAPRLASAHCGDALPAPSSAARVTFRFAELSVPGWLYVFLAPRSYTGEDLVEFHVPGNPLLARLLLDALVAAGARPADPGEFTARAYFNGRLDLTEAEGVAATIAAGSEQELRAARQLMAGELARRLRPASDLIAETLALVEVGIDFSEEDVTFLSAGEVASRCARADADLRELLEQSTRFERLTHEPAVVLAGRPNAGKSTLLNALAGHERAVTSPVAGTTRDVLTAAVALPRGIVRLIDAAGVEADVSAPNGIAAGGIVSEEIVSDGIASDGTASDGTADRIVSARIAADMRRHALRAVETADALVLVRDATDDRPDIDLPRRPDLVVRSKADLLTRGGGGGAGQAPDAPLSVSAKTGHNLAALRDALDRLAFGDAHAGGASLALNARHVRAVSEARAALARAAERIPGGAAELAALELREALDALGSVIGVVSPDDVLGRVFSAFCIGK